MVSQRGIGCALAAAGVSGVAVFVNGLAVAQFADATVYTTAKNLLAGGLLAVVLLASLVGDRERSSQVRTAARRAWPTLAVIALVGGAVPFVLFFEGLARASSTNAAFIHKTLVVWVALGATFVLRERLTAIHLGAIALLVGGHLVLSGGLGAAAFGTAELLVLGATLLWAAEVLVVKRVLGPSGRDVPAPLAATTRMAGGSVILVAWIAVTGRLGDLLALNAGQWLWILLTGSTLAAFVATWYTALSLAPAVDVTAVLVLGAVITGLLNTGFRDVPLTVDSTGYVLIAAGVAAVAGRSIATHPLGRRAAA